MEKRLRDNILIGVLIFMTWMVFLIFLVNDVGAKDLDNEYMGYRGDFERIYPESTDRADYYNDFDDGSIYDEKEYIDSSWVLHEMPWNGMFYELPLNAIFAIVNNRQANDVPYVDMRTAKRVYVNGCEVDYSTDDYALILNSAAMPGWGDFIVEFFYRGYFKYFIGGMFEWTRSGFIYSYEVARKNCNQPVEIAVQSLDCDWSGNCWQIKLQTFHQPADPNGIDCDAEYCGAEPEKCWLECGQEVCCLTKPNGACKK